MSSGFAVVEVRPLTVNVLVPPGAMDAGLNEHVGPEAQAKLILPVKLLGAVAWMVNWADPVPIKTVEELDAAESEKFESPVPVSEMACGVLAASSAMLTEPVLAPVPVGVNVMETTQLALTARLVPQVFVSAKSPVDVMLVMFNVPFPVLVTVTFFGALVVPYT